MSNFSFIEYSFDPRRSNPEEIYSSLNRLGFVQRNVHASNESSMWTQNQCIILLRESSKVDSPCITGLGLVVDETAVNSEYYFEKECGMLVTHDPNGFRILAMPEKSLSKMITHGYKVVDRKQYETTGLEYFSGIVYNTKDSGVINFYENLGFKFTKNSDRYDTLMSTNNRFTLLLNKTDDSNSIDILYADTNDVFKTTSHYTVAGFNSKDYIIDKDSLTFGVKLNHKITGYNCLAKGNQESYTIENIVKNPLPSFDLVFRTRKQYLHIEEEIVETHYATA
jgi:4-hydroxyphenylpyruvate dioxygenase-like putative hemolysin